MCKTYTRRFVIASYQTDVNTRVRPSAMLELMQEMAGAHAEKLNIGRTALDPMSLAWVLTRVEVRMERYPVSGEEIEVETFPMPNRRVFFPRYFLFRDRDGHQIGCAGTMWVVLDVNTRKMADPTKIVPLLPDNRDLTAPFGMPAGVEDAAGDAIEEVRLPVYTDLDMNGHVNNTKYVDWACNALGVDAMRAGTLKRFAVNFHQEILPGQEVRTVLRRDGNVFSYSGFEGDKRHFDVGGVLEAE